MKTYTKLRLTIQYPDDNKQQFTILDDAWDLSTSDMVEHLFNMLLSAGHQYENVYDAFCDIVTSHAPRQTEDVADEMQYYQNTTPDMLDTNTMPPNVEVDTKPAISMTCLHCRHAHNLQYDAPYCGLFRITTWDPDYHCNDWDARIQ